jgi:hypothetical protein
MKSFLYITFLALCLLLAACSSTPSSRISKDEALFNTYTPAERKMIRTRQIGVGFDQDQVRMALGEPSAESTVDTAAGKQIVWEYRKLKPSVGLSVGASTGSWGSGIGSGIGVEVSPNRTKLLKRVVFNRHTGSVESIESFD